MVDGPKIFRGDSQIPFKLTKSKFKASFTNPPKTILVFGSTGFVGPYIVAALLTSNPSTKIICLNRSADGERRTLTALAALASSAPKTTSVDLSRLTFIVGDITQPSFGLSPSQVATLRSSVTDLIFNAWNANWGIPLSAFEPLLGALKYAIQFCTSSASHSTAAKKVRLTFISSICATGEHPLSHPSSPSIPETPAMDMTCAMAHGYAESKCIAEQLLARANEQTGMSVAIIRAGQVGGCEEGGTWPVQGWLYSVFKKSSELGYWPAKVQPLDWLPADTLARGISRVVHTTIEPSKTAASLEVYNMVHPSPVPWSLLYETLQEEFGLQAKEVNLPEWLDRITNPRHFKLYAFFRGLKQGREDSFSFENENAKRVLEDVKPITKEVLSAWLGGWGMRFDGKGVRAGETIGGIQTVGMGPTKGESGTVRIVAKL